MNGLAGSDGSVDEAIRLLAEAGEHELINVSTSLQTEAGVHVMLGIYQELRAIRLLLERDR